MKDFEIRLREAIEKVMTDNPDLGREIDRLTAILNKAGYNEPDQLVDEN